MKMSYSWLQNHLTTDWPVEEIVAGLVQLGHEVDAVVHEGAAFENVVVGYVLAREQHPDSDRLGVCTVELGPYNVAGQPRTIVCGAPNVRAGLTVAVALPGAVLPGDFAIQQSKIRGVVSDGMICSERELGLGDEHNGIWEMPMAAAPGTPLAQVLQLDDVILDVAVTPNRGDCLSVRGLARDLAALGAGELQPVPEITYPAQGQPAVQVHLNTPDCMAFSLLELTHIQNGPSPDWLQRWLQQAGLKPRNLVVDVTNYILLAFGQPLHAYDADLVQGGITVNAAEGTETLHGIGGVTVPLKAGDITICDASGVIGLGGVLGGASTAVSAHTSHIYLEAAWFDRSRIARTGQAHALVTDARYRFERGVDPSQVLYANQLAAQLLAEYAGAQVMEPLLVGQFCNSIHPIAYDPGFCQTFGGIDVSTDQQREILQRLGFGFTDMGASWHLHPPTWRTYMRTPEDVVEEVLRVVGYETVPAVLPPMAAFALRDAHPTLPLQRLVRHTLVGAGYLEIMSYSFIKHSHAALFQPDGLQQLDNPLDADLMTTMRPSLLPGLLSAAHYNADRQQTLTQLLEIGTVFLPTGEEQHAAGLCLPGAPRHWQGQPAAADVFTAKAAALQVILAAGVNLNSLQILPQAHVNAQVNASNQVLPWAHPGRSGQILQGKTVLAEFGEVHPSVAQMFDLATASAFVVNLTRLAAVTVKTKPLTISQYPSVERDLAFVLPVAVSAQDVVRTVQSATKPLVQDVQVFDAYHGEHVPAGHKSLAVSVTLQSMERTLTETDITQTMEAAVHAVAKHYGGTLRS